jgi:hypothetical protein
VDIFLVGVSGNPQIAVSRLFRHAKERRIDMDMFWSWWEAEGKTLLRKTLATVAVAVAEYLLTETTDSGT